MKKWYAVTVMALVSTLSLAADNWVAGELKEASAQLDKRQFAQAFEICHNLLLIHSASPLSRNAADEARFLLGAAGQKVKAGDPKTFSEEFLARAKRLNFVQVGCVWMPEAAKAKLPAAAAAKLDKQTQAKVCSQCNGACVSDCPNCENGKAKCPSCNGTGRAFGANRVTCPVCTGAGKSTCTFCRGCGFIACPKCGGTGLGK